MRLISSRLAASLLCALLCVTGSGAQELKTAKAMSADGFVDSIGINVHLHNGTIYSNFPLIEAALRDLGVRHTRDGLINTTWQEYYRRHAQLAADGIHGIFITGTDDTLLQLLRFTEETGGAVEGFEAPNEYDAAGDAQWAAKLSAWMPKLMIDAAAIRSPRKITVIGPALVTPGADAHVPGLAASFDEANMHNYFGGHNPGTSGWGDNGYGSIAWNLALTRKAWGDKPVVTTETGFLSDPQVPQGVGERVQALYTPRIFLEQAMHGVQRTYLYELADGDQTIPLDQRSFGLLRSDGTRKPAFVAVERLISILADPAPADSRPVASQPAQAASAAQLGFDTDAPELHHMLFQKRDGRLFLAFWLEVPALNDAAKEIAVKPVPFTLRTGESIASARVFSLDPAVAAGPAALQPGREFRLTALESVSIVELDPASR